MLSSRKKTKINAWILDYAFQIVWEEFVSSKSVDTNTNRELIQWVLDQPYEPSNERDTKFNILLLLCRFADGCQFNTRYQENSDLTVLEDTLQQYEPFHSLLSKDLIKDSEALQESIKLQAVLVCCRTGDFGIAEDVYQRLYPSKGKMDKEIREKIENIIKSRNKSAKFIKIESYESFLEKIVTFFGKVVKKFQTSDLLKFASNEADFNSDTDVVSTCGKLSKRKTSESGDVSPPKLKRSLENGTEKSPSTVNSPRLRNRKSRNEETETKSTTDTFQNDGIDKISDISNKINTKRFGNSILKSYGETHELTALSEKEEDSMISKIKQATSNKNKNASLVQEQKNDEDMPVASSSTSPDKVRLRRKRNSDILDTSLGTRVSKDSVMDKHNEKNKLQKPSPSKNFASRPSGVRIPWTILETDEFYKAVLKIGVGNWSQMREYLRTFRTNVQLKDRWRSIQNGSDLERLIKKFGDYK